MDGKARKKDTLKNQFLRTIEVWRAMIVHILNSLPYNPDDIAIDHISKRIPAKETLKVTCFTNILCHIEKMRSLHCSLFVAFSREKFPVKFKA